jgi:hypothetical protein
LGSPTVNTTYSSFNIIQTEVRTLDEESTTNTFLFRPLFSSNTLPSRVQRQMDPKTRPFPNFTLQIDKTPMLMNDLVTDRQPQPAPIRPRRKKWVKNPPVPIRDWEYYA